MMARRQNVSAGLLLFRRGPDGLELFLAHPGGPFWRGREEGVWTIPKGIVEPHEAPLEAAVREFHEETGIEPVGPFLELGAVRQKGGKLVHAWAWEGDADPQESRSNLVQREWPPHSGRIIAYPEVDRCGWHSPSLARRLINPAQTALIERLEALLRSGGSGLRAGS
jgi:predicted NUDIX family NTP pyrophosphohydrolase